MDLTKFETDVKTRTGFAGKLVVAVYGGGGMLRLEYGDEGRQCLFLGVCAGVARPTCAVQSTYVTHPDGVGVVAAAVCAGLFHGSACVDRSVEIDHIMVSDVAKTACTVPRRDFLDGDVASRNGRAAVNDDFTDGSHGFAVFVQVVQSVCRVRCPWCVQTRQVRTHRRQSPPPRPQSPARWNE